MQLFGVLALGILASSCSMLNVGESAGVANLETLTFDYVHDGYVAKYVISTELSTAESALDVCLAQGFDLATPFNDGFYQASVLKEAEEFIGAEVLIRNKKMAIEAGAEPSYPMGVFRFERNEGTRVDLVPVADTGAAHRVLCVKNIRQDTGDPGQIIPVLSIHVAHNGHDASCDEFWQVQDADRFVLSEVVTFRIPLAPSTVGECRTGDWTNRIEKQIFLPGSNRIVRHVFMSNF